MSLEHKHSLRFWKRVKKADLPKQYDTQKIQDLMTLVQKDAKTLGINNVSLAIEDKENAMYSTSSGLCTPVPMQIPTIVTVGYPDIENLSLEELRSVMWHELGHYIFPVYYPEIDEQYDKVVEQKDFYQKPKLHPAYYIVQTFCDELAYKKFGKTYIVAFSKLERMENKEYRYKDDWERLFPMMDYVDKHGFGYWKQLAKEAGIEVKRVNRSSVPGVKPNLKILDGLV